MAKWCHELERYREIATCWSGFKCLVIQFWITSHLEPLSEHTLRMALYRERRNSSTILVVIRLSELNICWDLHGLHRRPFKSQQMLGSEKWDPTKIVAVNDMRSACVQSQQHLFKKLFATLDDTEIWKCLQKGFSIALEQLRTLDVGKRAFCLHPMCL